MLGHLEAHILVRVVQSLQQIPQVGLAMLCLLGLPCPDLVEPLAHQDVGGMETRPDGLPDLLLMLGMFAAYLVQALDHRPLGSHRLGGQACEIGRHHLVEALGTLPGHGQQFGRRLRSLRVGAGAQLADEQFQAFVEDLVLGPLLDIAGTPLQTLLQMGPCLGQFSKPRLEVYHSPPPLISKGVGKYKIDGSTIGWAGLRTIWRRVRSRQR